MVVPPPGLDEILDGVRVGVNVVVVVVAVVVAAAAAAAAVVVVVVAEPVAAAAAVVVVVVVVASPVPPSQTGSRVPASRHGLAVAPVSVPVPVSRHALAAARHHYILPTARPMGERLLASASPALGGGRAREQRMCRG